MDSFLSIQRFESLSQLADGSTTQLEDTLQMLEELKDLKTLKEYEPIVQSYCQMRMQRKYLKDALAKTQVR